MRITRLTIDDLKAVQSLLSLKNRIFKYTIQTDPVSRIQKTLSDPLHYYYGSYIGERLVGVGAAELWKTLPYYNIGDFFFHPDCGVNEYRDFSVMTVNEIMKDMEARQRYQFYMLTLLRQTQKQSILNGTLWPFPKSFSCFDRYNITVEAIVKANEESRYETHRWMMANQIFPIDLWIRKGTLKNELLITKLSEEAFGENK